MKPRGRMQGHFFVLDPPNVFSALWKCVQPWVDPVTKAKVTFCKCAFGALALQCFPYHTCTMHTCRQQDLPAAPHAAAAQKIQCAR